MPFDPNAVTGIWKLLVCLYNTASYQIELLPLPHTRGAIANVEVLIKNRAIPRRS